MIHSPDNKEYSDHLKEGDYGFVHQNLLELHSEAPEDYPGSIRVALLIVPSILSNIPNLS